MRKKFILLATTMLFTTMVQAYIPDAGKYTHEELKQVCDIHKHNAIHIMRMKQNGTHFFNAIKKNPETSERLSNVYSSIVILAYSKERKNTVVERERVVERFGNKVYLDCFKGLRDGIRDEDRKRND